MANIGSGEPAGTVDVVLEIGAKRVFAAALAWPGWCRGGRTEEQALAALAEYEPRYAAVARQAGVPFAASTEFRVLERLPGGATTDFGAPGAVASTERAATSAAQAGRLAALARAAWAVLDEVAAVTPAELRKGPRGGGRDRDKMLTHVLEAEAAYARAIGVRVKPPAFNDRPAVESLRTAIAEVLATPVPALPEETRGWPVRYAARRIAWHVLDHAWEMQDRTP